jgi:hypothetical protein
MERTRWIERQFQIDLPMGWMENVLIRLEGAPIRLEHYFQRLDSVQAGTRVEGKWSIKEHVGHLGDLELLHHARITDFVARNPELKAADMQNRMTEEADHNQKGTWDLLAHFAAGRAQFIQALRRLDADAQAFQSIHPRLQTPMKPVDMAFFVAEHDDHHIAYIVQLIKYWQR